MQSNELDLGDVESNTQSIGLQLFKHIDNYKVPFFDRETFLGKLQSWALQDEELRTNLFRLVDVLPSLSSSQSIIEHAQAYLSPCLQKRGRVLGWGLNISPKGIPAKVAASGIKKQVAAMGRQYIIAENSKAAVKELYSLRSKNRGYTADLLGEACFSEREADENLSNYLNLIRDLKGAGPGYYKPLPRFSNHFGEKSHMHISVKLSALTSHFHAESSEFAIRALKIVLRVLFREAMNSEVFVNIDMEDTSKLDIILSVFTELLLEEEFKKWDQVGIVVQAYLKRSKDILAHLINWAEDRSQRVCVRLVKGAYWDTETILARQANWDVPVWGEKSQSDANYEELSKMLLENIGSVYPAFASHNVRSIAHSVAYAEALGISKDEYEVQCLYGMGNPVKEAVLREGIYLREYVPVGDMIKGMSYLVRRLLENSSNEGFISQGLYRDGDVEALLKAPSAAGNQHKKSEVESETFKNYPCIDFTIQIDRDRIRSEIVLLRNKLISSPIRISPIVNGKELQDCTHFYENSSPEDLSLIISQTGQCEFRTFQEAVRHSTEYGRKTINREVEGNSVILKKVAGYLSDHKYSFIAAIVLEAGKPWKDADAEVAEAIDFCRYYALEYEKISTGLDTGKLDAEYSFLRYEPRGLTAVICPWNFPLAIPCGMFAAAFVTGNPVIMKPAEQTPLVAYMLFQAFLKSGMSPEAAAFLPGKGEEIGSWLVDSTAVQTVVFTGSKAVGFEIIKKASEIKSDQYHIKRVIAEMGGKNAIVVDESADLDQAIKGVLESAFAFSGQKCSALSRLYIHSGSYERLINRLSAAVESLRTGPSSDPSFDLGPLIDEDAMKRISMAALEAGVPRAVGKVDANAEGWFQPARLYVDLPNDHFLLGEELFGPILVAVKVESFEEGVSRANQNHYGLTGAVFSRDPNKLEYAKRCFDVGNLYLNRSCTAAMVGRHPFGGAKHSGVGSKAGGPDYLKQFLNPKLIAENRLRQGFAPMNYDNLEVGDP